MNSFNMYIFSSFFQWKEYFEIRVDYPKIPVVTVARYLLDYQNAENAVNGAAYYKKPVRVHPFQK